MKKKITVYLGSSEQCPPIYRETAKELGKNLAENGFTIIYGGANVGTMKALADGALEVSGEVIGVLPKWFKGTSDIREKGIEIKHHGITRMIQTEDFAERKKVMEEMCDAAIVLPGGTGTMDELFTLATDNEVSGLGKDIYVLDINNYYAPLKALFKNMDDECFSKSTLKKHLKFCGSISEVIELLTATR